MFIGQCLDVIHRVFVQSVTLGTWWSRYISILVTLGDYQLFGHIPLVKGVPRSHPRISTEPLTNYLYCLFRRFTSHLRCPVRLGRGDQDTFHFWWHWVRIDIVTPFRWWKGPPLKPPLYWKHPCNGSDMGSGYSMYPIRVHTHLSGVVVLSNTVFGWNMGPFKIWQKWGVTPSSLPYPYTSQGNFPHLKNW